jgi:hypothetical protein
MLPLSEVVFLPSFPGRVEKLNASVGSEVKPPLMTVSSGDLIISAKVNPAQRNLVKERMKVQVLSDLNGDTLEAEVTSVGELQKDESGERSHPLTVTPKGQKIPEKLVGADLRLTVEAASTDSAVLVVPVTALYTSIDGQTAVQRRSPDGKSQQVPVTVGVTASGYASVTPLNGTLAEGEMVVIGGGT